MVVLTQQSIAKEVVDVVDVTQVHDPVSVATEEGRCPVASSGPNRRPRRPLGEGCR